MLDICDMSEKDNLLFCRRVKGQGLNYMSREFKTSHQPMLQLNVCLMSSDSQDARRHQSSSLRRNRNSRSNSPKAVSEDKRPSGDRKPSQPNTGNTLRGHNN